MILWHFKKKKPEERVIFSAGQDLHYLKRVAESALLKMKGACSALGWDGSSSVKNVRSHCLAPALPWSQFCVSSKLSALGQGRGCLPSSTAHSATGVWSPGLCLSAQQQLQCQLQVLISEKWAPCFWCDSLCHVGYSSPRREYFGSFWLTP